MTVDPAWDLAGLAWSAVIGPAGWRASLAIPLEPEVRLWRANLYRIDRPRDGRPAEFSAWSPTGAVPPDFHRPRRFGRLEIGER